MSKNKSSLSKAKSYKEIGDFWDSHDRSKKHSGSEIVLRPQFSESDERSGQAESVGPFKLSSEQVRVRSRSKK